MGQISKLPFYLSFIHIKCPRGCLCPCCRDIATLIHLLVRSDIGPAREATDISDERHKNFNKGKSGDRPEEEEEDLNESNYDEFNGRRHVFMYYCGLPNNVF